MGPLAGPVVAAAVVLPAGRAAARAARFQAALAPRRARGSTREIRERRARLCVAWLEPDEIDRLNIYRAGLEAMRRAVAGLRAAPDWLLVDARRMPGICRSAARAGARRRHGRLDRRGLDRGQGRSATPACASSTRAIPGYGFARNAGYATPEHLRALRERGPSADAPPLLRTGRGARAQGELRMPHVVIEGDDRPAPPGRARFGRCCCAAAATCYTTGELYLERGGRALLVEALAIEAGRKQPFYVRISRHERGSMSVRIDPLTHPDRSDGVTRSWRDRRRAARVRAGRAGRARTVVYHRPARPGGLR